jgi:hypothetical protein
MAQEVNIGRWQDRWVEHPFPNMGEPEKAMCYLTDIQHYDEDHLAWLYNKASLHAVDRFFCRSEGDYLCWRDRSAAQPARVAAGLATAPINRLWSASCWISFMSSITLWKWERTGKPQLCGWD